jgi:hypothetical protein
MTTMPRYHFHIYDEVETLDTEGLELPGIEAAIAVAIHELRQLAAYELERDGTVDMATRIDIADDAGRVIERVHFDDLLDS